MRCWNCGCKFEEPEHIEYYAENYFGVGSMFESKNRIVIAECPSCGSSDIEEYCEEDMDEYEE